jgi:ABC-type molybdate transport system substrate-binding protein
MQNRTAPKLSVLALTVLCLAVLLAIPASAQPAPEVATPAGQVRAMEALNPPWQRRANDDAIGRGLEFTVPPVDVLADFHGSIDHPELVLFVSGNYFFAVAGLVDAFTESQPRFRGRIYYETLPPGLLLKQMEAGGTVTAGNMTWTVKPDVFMAELTASNELVQQGKLLGPAIAFATNNLTIMVPAGNPAHVTALADLARAGLALAMPNPQFEGIARQARASLVKAGGEALAETVYGSKVRDGTTVLTRIHHRQTPLFLMQHIVEAGVTWKSEAIFQEAIGNPIGRVEIPAEHNTLAVYSAAMVPDAPHPDTARVWLNFIRSDAAFKVLARYDFKRYQASTP